MQHMDSTHLSAQTTPNETLTDRRPHLLIPLPDSPYYLWQAEVQATAFEDLGFTATWLIYTIEENRYNPTPELTSFRSRPGVDARVVKDWRPREERHYHPAMKPGLIGWHFAQDRDAAERNSLIIDPDVIPTGAVEYPIAAPGIVWGTDTDSYTGEKYLRSKGAWRALTGHVGHDPSSDTPVVGVGAQYAVCGSPGHVWHDIAQLSPSVYQDCHTNGPQWKWSGEFPIQAWCAEMYVTQLMLLRAGIKVQPHPSMSMVWADGPASGWEKDGFYHCAGVPTPAPGKFCKTTYSCTPPWKMDIPPLSDGSSSQRYVEYIKRTGACR